MPRYVLRSVRHMPCQGAAFHVVSFEADDHATAVAYVREAPAEAVIDGYTSFILLAATGQVIWQLVRDPAAGPFREGAA